MPPYLVRDDVMYGTAQLPKFADDQFLATRTITRHEMMHDALKYASEADQEAYRAGKIDLTALVDRTLRERAVQGGLLAHPHRRGAADQSRAREDHATRRSCRSG